MPQISLDWDTVKRTYPMRPLTGGLKAYMDHVPGTPCCVQMSHALAGAGCYVGPRSNRRVNDFIATPLGRHRYLLAVDEMHWFLEQNFGAGEEISRGENGARRRSEEMIEVLTGRTGVLVFREPPYGKHTELWDVDHMHQPHMSPALFNTPQVLFWDLMTTAIG